MRRALAGLLGACLVACGGGSEKPPAQPQAAPVATAPQNAPVAADEQATRVEPEPDPQVLPPADVGEERGLRRQPQPAPPPGAGLAGYPPACVEYLEVFLRLAECDKLGPAKESMKQGYDATVEAWEGLRTQPTPEVVAAWSDGCKAGVDGLRDTAVAMGCPL